MKICPVCEARAFDDASTCYGCLYRFGDDDSAVGGFGAELANTEPSEDGALPHAQSQAGVLPEFLIKFTPVKDASGGVAWSCVVETATT